MIPDYIREQVLNAKPPDGCCKSGKHTEMADASDRIREHRERKEKLEIAAEEGRALLKERRQFLDSADTIATFAEELLPRLRSSVRPAQKPLPRLPPPPRLRLPSINPSPVPKPPMPPLAHSTTR